MSDVELRKDEKVEDYINGKLTKIVNDKLTNDQIEELKDFFRNTMSMNLEYDEENFFKSIAYEMTGELKALAQLIVDFKKDIKSKINPELTDIATKYIPQATDQLEGVIETTETAANKIMDNLENMQGQTEKTGEIFSSLKNGGIPSFGGQKLTLESSTLSEISPLVDYMESEIQNTMSLISDSFVQMSFQDLTGQRIRRIMVLVRQMEDKLKDMIIAFGIKLNVHEKNPDITKAELQKAVEEKVTALAGPQKAGQGLDQGDIDDLLANL